MTNLTVAIPEELTSFVREAVKEGQFSGMSEVVASALYALRDQVELDRIQEDRLRHEVVLGMDQCARGEVAHYDQSAFLSQMHAEFRPATS